MKQWTNLQPLAAILSELQASDMEIQKLQLKTRRLRLDVKRAVANGRRVRDEAIRLTAGRLKRA